MKKKKAKKRFITLVEMMIVMFLIAMITGVIAYNYTGSLEEGKAFKTKNGMEKIHTILDLYYAVHPDEVSHVDADWKGIIGTSQLVKNPNDLILDGWGVEYKVSHSREGGDIEIFSEKYNQYAAAKGKSSLFAKEKK